MSSRKNTVRLGLAVVGVALATNVSIGRAAQQSAVVDWYQIGFTTANAVAQPGAPQTRSLAIVAVSINDAVNAVTREFPRYASTLAPPVGASPVAAAIGAAYRSLTQLYPPQAAPLASSFLQSVAKYQISGSDAGFLRKRSSRNSQFTQMHGVRYKTGTRNSGVAMHPESSGASAVTSRRTIVGAS